MEESPNLTKVNFEKLIDLEKVISSKNPNLLRIIPVFLINYFKKIIHENDLNNLIYNHKYLMGVDFVDAMIKKFGINIKVIGSENIPATGRKFIASNHPLGGPDGMALISIIGKYRKDMKFIVNDLLLNIDNLRPVFLPVNKHGGNPKAAVALLDSAFASNELMMTFPFGLVSRKSKGKIIDLEWKKNFISKSKEYKRDIVPVHISGRNSNFFYNLANLRKFLRIKANIEMIFLPNEMYSSKNKDIIITFGKPISFTNFTNKYSDQQWAEMLRLHVYKLPENPDATF
jgi:putative hemolysin